MNMHGADQLVCVALNLTLSLFTEVLAHTFGMNQNTSVTWIILFKDYILVVKLFHCLDRKIKAEPVSPVSLIKRPVSLCV